MALAPTDLERIAAAAGRSATGHAPLSGGCVGEVYRVDLENGRAVVAKVDRDRTGTLPDEGWMLDLLAERTDLPAPRTLLAEPDLLVMTVLPGTTGAGSPGAQRHAADLLASLHGVTAERFGLERPTRIGGLAQPNDWSDSWIDFYRQRRLLEMARQASEAGRLPDRAHDRVRRVADRLDRLIDEPDAPSLVHGDIWSGNILSEGDRVTGFIDPALHYGHPEVELAFITLFNTLGAPFFDRYAEQRPLRPGFFETRRTVYLLYPLLVHVRLFGAGYLGQLESCLGELGA
ncbi:MAG: fructosamine kinase family protein [Phycisphaerales bacterium]